MCVCGRAAVVVRHRGKKMISCPDPVKCRCNLRTLWYGSKDAAVAAWNKMVEAAKLAAQ